MNDLIDFYTAINVQHQEMAENDLETITLFYRIQNLAKDPKFTSLPPSSLKTNIFTLQTKLAMLIQKIMISLVADIKNEIFERTLEAVNMVRYKGAEEVFLADLVKLYLITSTLSQFTQLYDFAQSLPFYTSECNAHAAIWRELQSSGAGDTMEALAVWIRASQITKELHDLDIHQCKSIAGSAAPAFKHSLISLYRKYIKNGRTKEIQDLHKTYRMEYFFADYISTLGPAELQKNKFEKLLETIDALPFIEDVCFATAAVCERFKIYPQMLGTFEHFQALNIIMRTKALPNYENEDEIAKSKCESASENTPPVFHTLLYGNTSQCRLLNRRYQDQALYCPDSSSTDEFGYRNIYTMTSKKLAADQFWNVTLAGWTDGVFLRNNQHGKVDLRFINGNVRGSEKVLDLKLDYFRVHAKDNYYIMLEPISAGKFKSSEIFFPDIGASNLYIKAPL